MEFCQYNTIRFSLKRRNWNLVPLVNIDHVRVSMKQTLYSNILKPLSCSIPNQPLLHIVKHGADWVSPFPRSQHFLLPVPKFFHTPLSPPPSSSPLKCARVSGNHHHPPCYLPFLLPTLAIIIIIRHVTGSSGVPAPSAAGCSPS